MKLGHTNDEIKYLDTAGTVARYAVILDGEDTMHILCNSAVSDDQEKVICIARADDTGEQETKGYFAMKTELLSDADGAPLGVGEPRVDEKSVYTYVIPRLHVLLGRLLRAA